mgnify:CR=1 FL=1
MLVSIFNTFPTITNLPGQGGGSGPPPVVCYIELETSGGTDYVELEPAASTDVMILELCGGTPPTSNVLAQNGTDNLITQNSEQIIIQ